MFNIVKPKPKKSKLDKRIIFKGPTLNYTEFSLNGIQNDL